MAFFRVVLYTVNEQSVFALICLQRRVCAAYAANFRSKFVRILIKSNIWSNIRRQHCFQKEDDLMSNSQEKEKKVYETPETEIITFDENEERILTSSCRGVYSCVPNYDPTANMFN